MSDLNWSTADSEVRELSSRAGCAVEEATRIANMLDTMTPVAVGEMLKSPQHLAKLLQWDGDLGVLMLGIMSSGVLRPKAMPIANVPHEAGSAPDTTTADGFLGAFVGGKSVSQHLSDAYPFLTDADIEVRVRRLWIYPVKDKPLKEQVEFVATRLHKENEAAKKKEGVPIKTSTRPNGQSSPQRGGVGGVERSPEEQRFVNFYASLYRGARYRVGLAQFREDFAMGYLDLSDGVFRVDSRTYDLLLVDDPRRDFDDRPRLPEPERIALIEKAKRRKLPPRNPYDETDPEWIAARDNYHAVVEKLVGKIKVTSGRSLSAEKVTKIEQPPAVPPPRPKLSTVDHGRRRKALAAMLRIEHEGLDFAGDELRLKFIEKASIFIKSTEMQASDENMLFANLRWMATQMVAEQSKTKTPNNEANP